MAKEIEWVVVERGELRPADPLRGFSERELARLARSAWNELFEAARVKYGTGTLRIGMSMTGYVIEVPLLHYRIMETPAATQTIDVRAIDVTHRRLPKQE